MLIVIDHEEVYAVLLSIKEKYIDDVFLWVIEKCMRHALRSMWFALNDHREMYGIHCCCL